MNEVKLLEQRVQKYSKTFLMGILQSKPGSLLETKIKSGEWREKALKTMETSSYNLQNLDKKEKKGKKRSRNGFCILFSIFIHTALQIFWYSKILKN